MNYNATALNTFTLRDLINAEIDFQSLNPLPDFTDRVKLPEILVVHTK